MSPEEIKEAPARRIEQLNVSALAGACPHCNFAFGLPADEDQETAEGICYGCSRRVRFREQKA
jgi:hypothetical protein